MRSLLIASLFTALVGAAGHAGAASLADLQWDKRVVVVFAPTDTLAGEFRDTLDNTAGVRSRDIAWFVLAPSGETFSNINTPIPRRQLLDLHENGGIEAVLIGKDGGVKARQTEDFDLSAFFGKIDQMPMRRREMSAP